jgi:hypothetical protein
MSARNAGILTEDEIKNLLLRIQTEGVERFTGYATRDGLSIIQLKQVASFVGISREGNKVQLLNNIKSRLDNRDYLRSLVDNIHSVPFRKDVNTFYQHYSTST